MGQSRHSNSAPLRSFVGCWSKATNAIAVGLSARLVGAAVAVQISLPPANEHHHQIQMTERPEFEGNIKGLYQTESISNNTKYRDNIRSQNTESTFSKKSQQCQ